MLLDAATPSTDAIATFGPAPAAQDAWGADSEYGRLTDVLLCAPTHLKPVPCCAVTTANLRRGFDYSVGEAIRQHHALEAVLRASGVRCHIVDGSPALPDLAFARDATLMTPWGLVELSPATEHRRAESRHIARFAAERGVPLIGRIERGTVEGGDVCLVRPGIVIIGCSGERTNEAGAGALAALFERHGWRAYVHAFDPHFLHLDTQFAMLDADRALAAVDVLDDAFLAFVEGLGIELVPVTYKEVQQLGGNVLSLGGGRIVSAASNWRVNRVLLGLGYDVAAVDLSQFTACGGGVHCLTLPLARDAATAPAPRAASGRALTFEARHAGRQGA
jgi:N-dimethylarginine dimethylaminohydrolase